MLATADSNVMLREG